jgi:hypothetical protein
MTHISNLYAKRHLELWRSPVPARIFRDAAALASKAVAAANGLVEDNDASAAAATAAAHDDLDALVALGSVEVVDVPQHLVDWYGEADEVAVLGETPKEALPQDVLQAARADGRPAGAAAGAAAGADGAGAAPNVIRLGGHGGGAGNQQVIAGLVFDRNADLPEHIRDTLLRFELLFGPLPPPQEGDPPMVTVDDAIGRYNRMLFRLVQEKQQGQQQRPVGTDAAAAAAQ